MAFPQEKIYTLEDIYALPDGQRAELIDRRIYNMAPPNRIHQKISHILEWAIENYIRHKKGSEDKVPVCIFEGLGICIADLLETS